MNNVPKWEQQPLCSICFQTHTMDALQCVFCLELGWEREVHHCLTHLLYQCNNLTWSQKKGEKKRRGDKVINNLWAAAYFPIGCPGEVCSTSNPACLSTSITVLLPRKWPKIQVENSTVNQSAALTHSSFSCWNNTFGRWGYQKLD